MHANHGEDSDFSLRMCRAGAIRTCRMASEEPIYIYIPSKYQDSYKPAEVCNPPQPPQTPQERQADLERLGNNRPKIPSNMKSSVWRREGRRSPGI